jgi:hypothetical protein
MQRLSSLRTLNFTTHSARHDSLCGTGSGAVDVTRPEPDTVVLHESGQWRSALLAPTGATSFRNVQQFQFDYMTDRVTVAHLRNGPASPVFLFDLRQIADDVWRETIAHQCGDDTYRCQLSVLPSALLIHWRITGAAKDETLRYTYSHH